MKVVVGELHLALTDQQADELREQLGSPNPQGVSGSSGEDMIDAATLAKRMGVSREYVYAHAEELEGQPLGNGPRPRWRFPQPSTESAPSPAPPGVEPDPPKRRRRRGGSAGLLEVRGKPPGNASGKVPADG